MSPASNKASPVYAARGGAVTGGPAAGGGGGRGRGCSAGTRRRAGVARRRTGVGGRCTGLRGWDQAGRPARRPVPAARGEHCEGGRRADPTAAGGLRDDEHHGPPVRRVRLVPRERLRVRPPVARASERTTGGRGADGRGTLSALVWGPTSGRRSSSSSTAAPRTPTRGTPSPWPSAGRSWPSTCRATATRLAATTAPTPGRTWPTAVAQWPSSGWPPRPTAVVGHVARGPHGDRAGGRRPELVRRLVLVDVTPGVNRRKAQGHHRLRRRAADLPELRRHPGPDHRAQPDPQRVVAPAGHPPQRPPAAGRLVGVELRPAAARPQPSGDACRRTTRIRRPHRSGTSWRRSRCPLLLVRGGAVAGGRRRRRGRAPAPAAGCRGGGRRRCGPQRAGRPPARAGRPHRRLRVPHVAPERAGRPARRPIRRVAPEDDGAADHLLEQLPPLLGGEQLEARCRRHRPGPTSITSWSPSRWQRVAATRRSWLRSSPMATRRMPAEHPHQALVARSTAGRTRGGAASARSCGGSGRSGR